MSDIATLDRWIASMRWRDKLPLICVIALVASLPAALMLRLENTIAARNTINAAAQTEYTIRPVYTPLPHHLSNGMVSIYVVVDPNGTVAHLQSGWHDGAAVSSRHPLYDLSAAAARQWQFDIGERGVGLTLRLTFVYHDGGETDATWATETGPSNCVDSATADIPKSELVERKLPN